MSRYVDGSQTRRTRGRFAEYPSRRRSDFQDICMSGAERMRKGYIILVGTTSFDHGRGSHMVPISPTV